MSDLVHELRNLKEETRYDDLIMAAADRIEALETDRDHWLKAADDHHVRMCKLEAELVRVHQSNAELVEALKAAAAQCWHRPDDTYPCCIAKHALQTPHQTKKLEKAFGLTATKQKDQSDASR